MRSLLFVDKLSVPTKTIEEEASRVLLTRQHQQEEEKSMFGWR